MCAWALMWSPLNARTCVELSLLQHVADTLTVFKLTMLRAQEELWELPTMGSSAGELYKPVGAFRCRSRANGIASGRGDYFSSL